MSVDDRHRRIARAGVAPLADALIQDLVQVDRVQDRVVPAAMGIVRPWPGTGDCDCRLGNCALRLEITKSRVLISRFLALAILPLVLFTSHSFPQEGLTDTLFEVSGFALLSLATFGRLWALLYVAGNKRVELVTSGPYSIMRHPLYVFSLIGIIGIGLTSENVLVLACLVLFYMSYYPFAVHAEEAKLTRKFGPAYRQYMTDVPAFMPRLSLYKAPERLNVNMGQFVHNFGDAIWFVWMFLALHLVEALQVWGVLPVLWRVP